MDTRFLQPKPFLQPFVKEIMVLERNGPAHTIMPLTFYADGFPGVIYQQAENGMFVGNTDKKLEQFFLYGQTVKPVEFVPKGSYRMIIFFFYPYVVKSLFGFSSREVTDSCLDLGLLPSAALMNMIARLQEEQTVDQQVEQISDYLIRTLRINDVNVDNVIHYAVAQIRKNNGQASLKDLRDYLKVAERTFERKFEQHVGVAPKLFARICQFQSSLQQLSMNNFEKLSDLAYENGYADQSHFIRSFKEFTGLAPLDFYRQSVSQPKADDQK